MRNLSYRVLPLMILVFRFCFCSGVESYEILRFNLIDFKTYSRGCSDVASFKLSFRLGIWEIYGVVS